MLPWGVLSSSYSACSSKWTLYDSEVAFLGGEVLVFEPDGSDPYEAPEHEIILSKIDNLYSTKSSLKQRRHSSTLAVNRFVVGGRTEKEVRKMERTMKMKKMDGCLLHCDNYDSKGLLHMFTQWNADLQMFEIFTFEAKDFLHEGYEPLAWALPV